jgi:hypothetical protein
MTVEVGPVASNGPIRLTPDLGQVAKHIHLAEFRPVTSLVLLSVK